MDKNKNQGEPEVGAPLDKQGGRWFLHSRIDLHAPPAGFL